MRPVVAIIALLLFCCAREAPESKSGVVPGEKLYILKGKIVGRNVSDNTVRVDHEEIPGFMEAMVMDYSIRGAKVAELPADQQRIEAKLHVTDDGYWLTDVRPSP
ncbi:MAG TPA: copper-binding protein [Thermoanaerobaculia bacterium]|nr:copper-binding protein [Thermoanaerobaculia bacterium]